MKQNYEVLKNLLRHQNSNKLRPITCMSDTVCNNTPKGRAMNQPGTQCSSPLVECETTKHMVLGRGGTGKARHWAKWDTEVIMTSQLKLARADKKLSAT